MHVPCPSDQQRRQPQPPMGRQRVQESEQRSIKWASRGPATEQQCRERKEWRRERKERDARARTALPPDQRRLLEEQVARHKAKVHQSNLRNEQFNRRAEANSRRLRAKEKARERYERALKHELGPEKYKQLRKEEPMSELELTPTPSEEEADGVSMGDSD